MRLKQVLFWGMFVLIAFSACQQNHFDLLKRSFFGDAFDKQAMLKAQADEIIVPNYRRFVILSRRLDQLSQQFAAQPDQASLLELQSVWRDTIQQWVHLESSQFGAAEELRLRQQIHYWPRRVEHIQSVLDGSSSIETLAQQGATRKGLPVIEYLLFALPAEETIRSKRAHQYLKALSADLLKQAEDLYRIWLNQSAPAFANDASALNRQLNQWIMLLENCLYLRLSSEQEAPDSKASLALLQEALIGLSESYQGSGNLGVDDYLIAQGMRRLDIQVKEDLRVAQDALNEPQLFSEHLHQSDQLQRVRQALETLLRRFKVDVANGLNETVHFTSNDGD